MIFLISGIWRVGGTVLYMENQDGVLDRINQTKKDIIEQIEKDLS